MTLLFCVAAGSRLGYGHLARAASVARWLGAGHTCALAIRGTAGRFPLDQAGFQLVHETPARLLARGGWDGVVVDDPQANEVARLVRCARRAGVAVASFHDLGLAPSSSDLAIDGSLAHASTLPAARTLMGPRFMVLDPSLCALRRRGVSRHPDGGRVVISLGGGASSRHAVLLATALGRVRPDLEILVTSAFSVTSGGSLDRAATGTLGPGIHRLAAGSRFREVLSTAAVAVTGAGVTAYEAVALGVPTIPVVVVKTQQPTARAFLDQQLVVATRAHSVSHRLWRRSVIRDVLRAVGDGPHAAAVTRRARRVIDAQGGARVARELRQLFAAHRGHMGVER